MESRRVRGGGGSSGPPAEAAAPALTASDAQAASGPAGRPGGPVPGPRRQDSAARSPTAEPRRLGPG